MHIALSKIDAAIHNEFILELNHFMLKMFDLQITL